MGAESSRRGCEHKLILITDLYVLPDKSHRKWQTTLDTVSCAMERFVCRLVPRTCPSAEVHDGIEWLRRRERSAVD